MQKNVAGQKIGCQMVSATDGSAFTSAVTVYVTGDAGTQAAGSVGSGACTHEGNGYHTYAPAQAETNYDLVAFTFIGTGAVPATVQVFTSFPQTGDAYARLGAPAGASVSADVAAVKAQTAAIETDTQDLQTQVGTDGAGLTNMPWNAAWDAQVESKVTDALNAYDPPTNAEMEARTLAAASYATASALDAVDNFVDTEITAIKTVTDKLDTALEDDGSSGYQFTTLALENAPTGGAGTAPTVEEIRAEMDANSTKLANLDATVSSRLAPTAAGRTLDITATGEASANVTLWKGADAGDAPLKPTVANSTLAVDANGYAAADLKLWRGFPPNGLSSAGDVRTLVTEIDNPAMQNVADALLLAPSGAAASGSAMDVLADILEDTGTTIPAAIAGIGGLAGSGAISFPITVQDEDSNPIDGVEVWVTTDSAGTNVVAGTLSTDAMGLAIFMLDAGDYYVWRQASGFNFTNPVAITVS